MRHKIILSFLLLIPVLYILDSCSEQGEDNNPDFDRSQLLVNMADHLIIPSYSRLATHLEELQNATTELTSDPTAANLQRAQNEWEDAYESWQDANAFNFGPAGPQGLRKALIEEIGTFPVSKEKIENAIDSEDYNLTDANRDARGFLTIEYLLFDLQDDDQAILDLYTSESRKKYLNDVVIDVKTRVDNVLAEWQDSYRSEFISNDGTDAGSSISSLYNEFVKSYETIKNFKIGLPLGKQPGQVTTEPTLVEAYYSGQSVEMFKDHFHAIIEIWYGGYGKEGETGPGFDDYLLSVTGGESLVESTEQQIDIIGSALDNVPESPRFSAQLESNTDNIEILHTELQKNTRYFKSDMSSLLGIAITFSSGDGD